MFTLHFVKRSRRLFHESDFGFGKIPEYPQQDLDTGGLQDLSIRSNRAQVQYNVLAGLLYQIISGPGVSRRPESVMQLRLFVKALESMAA